MDDDKLTKLFDNFHPELTSSAQFMSTLKKNMQAVELIMQHNAALKRRNKLAVAIAAACGFISGVIMTLLVPVFTKWLSSISLTIPHLNVSVDIIDFNILAWIIMAGTCIITALNAYEIALAKLKA